MARSANATTEQQTMTSPGVRVPPPAVYALALGASWLLQRTWPLPFIANDTALWVGITLVAIGLAFALTSIVTMMRGRGTVNTNAPSEALVVTGIYRISRNPMYVALALMYTGFAIAMILPWGLALLPLLLIYTQKMVIEREEAFLSKAFGQAYTDYAAHVRRWL
jgi:protein-S-isoprenylcysteine O-methyltransferase Ste14